MNIKKHMLQSGRFRTIALGTARNIGVRRVDAVGHLHVVFDVDAISPASDHKFRLEISQAEFDLLASKFRELKKEFVS